MQNISTKLISISRGSEQSATNRQTDGRIDKRRDGPPNKAADLVEKEEEEEEEEQQ